MNPLALVQKFIPDGVIRARVLALARHLGQLAAGIVIAFVYKQLTAKGVDTQNAMVLATSIGTGIAAVIVAMIMALYAILDVNKVAKKMNVTPEQAKSDALGALASGKA